MTFPVVNVNLYIKLTSIVFYCTELEPNACESFNDSYENNLFTVHQVRGKFSLSNVLMLPKKY